MRAVARFVRSHRFGVFAACGFGVLAAGCGCGSRGGGLELEVKFEGFTPGCLEVTVADRSDAKNNGMTQVRVTQSRPYTVAIAKGKGWGSSWSLSISAREGSCTGRVVASLTDDSVEVPNGPVQKKTVTLSATDRDGDGWVAMSSGGTDCDDLQAMSFPGLAEKCTDGIDNDCAGGIDCADPSCAGGMCNDGDPCTDPDTCGPMGCRGAPIVCTTTSPCRQADAGRCEPGGCFFPLRPIGSSCGPASVCNGSGVCVPIGGELNCADGIDDDRDDAGIDCADSDCNASVCDAGLCETGATCQAGTCSGARVMCNSPSTCRDAGTCNKTNGLCEYPASAPGSPCSTDACLMSQTCDGNGMCGGGMPRSCPSAGACQVGFCDAGACRVAPASSGSCDDDAGCTFGDTCNAGVCTGTPYGCTAAPECRMPAVQACLGDGGCSWIANPAANGLRCDGGFCSDGGCEPPFPYDVSNVDPSQFPPGGAVNINCTVIVLTDDAGVIPSWCNGPAPNLYQTTQRGTGEPVLVVSMRSLTVTDAGVLYFTGVPGAVLLVFDPGATLVDGRISVRSLGNFPGAGADRAGCGTQSGVRGLPGIRGGGGGGGGWASGGARGGNGESNTGADGGAAIANPASFRPLLGGCPGGAGGPGMGGDGGWAGSGGGTLQLSVAGELFCPTMNARLTASGGGGGGGLTATRAGGGGGGSGGALLLEARRLNLADGLLTCNGGAGGEGADDADPGAAGEDGRSSQSGASTGGASGASSGGPGGAGAAGGALTPGAGGNGNSVGGGGGGGAAVGRIFLRAGDGGCVHAAGFSPAYTNAGGCN